MPSTPPKPGLRRPPAATFPLLKQRSWSPDTERDEAWVKRKYLHRNRKGQLSRSVTDDDLDELRGCIDLGFGFDVVVESPTAKKLARTFPALDLYLAVHRGCGCSPSESSSDGSPLGTPMTSFVSPGDAPELVKARLKQWAQVVACSVRQRC